MTVDGLTWRDVDPGHLHAVTVGILTGIVYGYNVGDSDIPKPGSDVYRYAECIAIDALRASAEWKESK